MQYSLSLRQHLAYQCMSQVHSQCIASDRLKLGKCQPSTAHTQQVFPLSRTILEHMLSMTHMLMLTQH